VNFTRNVATGGVFSGPTDACSWSADGIESQFDNVAYTSQR
jgi:hypothetical protein